MAYGRPFRSCLTARTPLLTVTCDRKKVDKDCFHCALTHVLGPWCGVHRTPSCDNDQQSIPSRSPHRLATTSDFFSGLYCRPVRPPLRDHLHLLWAGLLFGGTTRRVPTLAGKAKNFQIL
ncbi:hypothetical protein evm_014004 [Chilo suppressalis]|nr:hypothetical protein evm_014004 [Chilo suppressalis]